MIQNLSITVHKSVGVREAIEPVVPKGVNAIILRTEVHGDLRTYYLVLDGYWDPVGVVS